MSEEIIQKHIDKIQKKINGIEKTKASLVKKLNNFKSIKEIFPNVRLSSAEEKSRNLIDPIKKIDGFAFEKYDDYNHMSLLLAPYVLAGENEVYFGTNKVGEAVGNYSYYSLEKHERFAYIVISREFVDKRKGYSYGYEDEYYHVHNITIHNYNEYVDSFDLDDKSKQKCISKTESNIKKMICDYFDRSNKIRDFGKKDKINLTKTSYNYDKFITVVNFK